MFYYCCITQKEGMFLAEFPDLPNVMTQGHSEDEALFNAAEAMNGALESDVAHGIPLPECRAKARKGLHPIEVEANILIAWELRQLRGDASQSEIAARLGLSYQAYQRLENPVKGNPTIKTLQRVAKVFGKKLEISLT
jgi:Uncharacterized conserved protein